MKTSGTSNRHRQIAEIVSLEVWHDPFTNEGGPVSLHADVVFKEARMGGEDESKVQFKLSLRRATLILILDDDSNLKIDNSSVARDGGPISAQIKRRSVSRQSGAASAKGALGASLTEYNASLAIAGELGAEKNVERELTSNETISMIVSMQSLSAERHHQWDLSLLEGDRLYGRPWDAVKEPRLRLMDLRSNKSSIPDTVLMEIRCRREDLIIEDIKLSDQESWRELLKIGRSNQLIAAEAYIQTKLTEASLPVSKLSRDFSSLVIASVLAES